jgi:hypothetical protein
MNERTIHGRSHVFDFCYYGELWGSVRHACEYYIHTISRAPRLSCLLAWVFCGVSGDGWVWGWVLIWDFGVAVAVAASLSWAGCGVGPLEVYIASVVGQLI